LTGVDKSVLFDNNPDPAKIQSFLLRTSLITSQMPFGGIYFTSLDHTTRKYSYMMQVGNDLRIGQSSNYPSEGYRQMINMANLNNGIRKYLFFVSELRLINFVLHTCGSYFLNPSNIDHYNFFLFVHSSEI